MNQEKSSLSIQFFALGGLGIFTITLASGYAFAGQWVIAIISIVIASLWAITIQRRLKKAFTPLFILALLMAVYSIFSAAPNFLSLIAFLAALGTWDLLHFAVRMENKGEDPAIESQHLRRLGTVLGLSFIVTILAMLVHFQLHLGLELVLGLVLIISLGQAIKMLRDHPKKSS